MFGGLQILFGMVLKSVNEIQTVSDGDMRLAPLGGSLLLAV
jgi:hypothetical protein